jgi:hypothetical protein
VDADAASTLTVASHAFPARPHPEERVFARLEG